MPIYGDEFVVGERHASAPYEMREAEMIEFARKYDPQDFHTDPNATKDAPMGGLAAAGCQTVALSWKLAHDTGLFDGVLLAGIGLDEIRWHRPVRAGDLVHVEFFLLESRQSASKPDRQIVRFQYEMKNQDGEIVLTLQMLQVLKRRSARVESAS